MSCMLLLTSTLLTGALLTLQAMAQPGPTALPPANPVEPIQAILDAFKTHNVVALDEGSHGNEQGHAFRLALLRHPRFPDTVNDIVVEFGNALYQDVMDRFVRGEEVPDRTLRKVWQDTTQAHTVWDSPIYEELFRAVREINAKRPRDRHLRVLLGDPPLDWDKVRADDLAEWERAMAARDTHAAQVVEREVLAKQRRALLIFGGMHLQRGHIRANYESFDRAQTLVSLLARSQAARIFTVWTHASADLKVLQADATSWPVPSLALTRGTALGALDFAAFFPTQGRYTMRDGQRTPVPRDQWRVRRMEDQFDAVLYLGPPSGITHARLPAALCADPTYMEMRTTRMSLFPVLRADAGRVRDRCAPPPPPTR
jgi:hypothetical protein